MSKTTHTWVIVADSGRARLFIPDENFTNLTPAELPDFLVEVHGHARDLKSDRPGRSFSSAGGGGRHAIEPPHDYHKLEKHDFAAALAHALNDAHEVGKFDRLILVVPPRTLGELRTLLADKVQGQMQVIAKDLTKTPVAKLLAEVAGMVRKV